MRTFQQCLCLAGTNIRCRGNILLLILLFTAGCSTTEQAAAPADTFESRNFAYSDILLEFMQAGPGSQDVALKGSGDGMAEGAKMMAVAPLECLRGADPYTASLCIALAPFFPFITAAMVQDEEVSLRELDALYQHVELLNIQQQFRSEIERQAAAAGIPLTTRPTDGTAKLRAWLEPLHLVHDGYSGGDIALTVVSHFELVAPDGQVAKTVADEHVGHFDVDDWLNEGEPAISIARWMKDLAAEGLQETLLEWQPEIVLGPVLPAAVNKRNFIGIMQERWPTETSVRPTLEWQRLEEVMDPQLLNDVADISYELRIGGRYNGETHYFVTDLPEPVHQLTIDLQPCGVYIWEPRARFRYRNMRYTTSLRVREWSEGIWIPSPYPLSTPAPKCKNPTYY